MSSCVDFNNERCETEKKNETAGSCQLHVRCFLRTTEEIIIIRSMADVHMILRSRSQQQQQQQQQQADAKSR